MMDVFFYLRSSSIQYVAPLENREMGFLKWDLLVLLYANLNFLKIAYSLLIVFNIKHALHLKGFNKIERFKGLQPIFKYDLHHIFFSEILTELVIFTCSFSF